MPQSHSYLRPRRPRPAHRGRLGPRGALAALGLIAGTAAPLAAALAAASPALASPAVASPAAVTVRVGCPARPGAISCSPATLTPSLPNTSQPTFQVRQLVQCGSLMYAVGTFTQILSPNISGQGEVTYSRNNVFSFHATRPYRVTSWNPDVNGEVNSIAVGGPHCSTAYLGGTFTQVHGTSVHDIAAVSTSTGAVLSRFGSNANHAVDTLLLRRGRLLAGGYFTQINGQNRHYLVALDSSTGTPDNYLALNVFGHYQYKNVVRNGTRVYNQQLSHDGTRLLIEGDFTSVGGQSRQQVAMLSLGRRHAQVTPWTSPMFAGHCADDEPFYIRAAAWGPADNAVYTVATGYRPYGGTIGPTPRTGLCDTAAAFPASSGSVQPRWINYTGCDSLYAAAAGPRTVYIGGHERWAGNGSNCDAAGPGAKPAPGMAGLSEAAGHLVFNPTRSRGLGADDMLLTSAGLWIASDNLSGIEIINGKQVPFTSDQCGGVGNRAGICFLPHS